MKTFRQLVAEQIKQNKTVKSHPYYVYSPNSHASYRKIGRFKTEAEAAAHIKKIQPHMDGMKLVVGQGEYPK